MDETKFRETEAKYRQLKEKHAKGEISTEQVKVELKRLMVQDETGTYWMLGGKSGKWYRHDGTQWQEIDPYEIIKTVAEPEEAEEELLELDASAKISEEQEAEQEEENPFKSTESAEAADLSYPQFATETAGTAEGGDEAGIPVTSPGTESAEPAGTIEIGDTTVAADISYPQFATETEGDADSTESPYTTVAADISSAPFATEAGEAGEATGPTDEADSSISSPVIESAETVDASAAGISLDSFGTESPETTPTADNAAIGGVSVEDSTYGTYDTLGTYEIDTTAADEAEAADAAHDIIIERGKAEEETVLTERESISVDAAESPAAVDTQKFEYTSRESEEAVPLVATEPAAPEAPGTPEVPAATAAPQDYIACGVCKSRIPPYAIYCTFCGAHQKTLKQPTTVHSVKEESEMLVKSIKTTSFLFFLGGLGLILGVILGATFGVVKDFFSGLSSQLPMMLSETRGGVAGGLIFAAIGGIGGFILSAILSLILGGGYNLVAYIFGGIRFKIKR